MTDGPLIASYTITKTPLFVYVQVPIPVLQERWRSLPHPLPAHAHPGGPPALLHGAGIYTDWLYKTCSYSLGCSDFFTLKRTLIQ